MVGRDAAIDWGGRREKKRGEGDWWAAGRSDRLSNGRCAPIAGVEDYCGRILACGRTNTRAWLGHTASLSALWLALGETRLARNPAITQRLTKGPSRGNPSGSLLHAPTANRHALARTTRCFAPYFRLLKAGVLSLYSFLLHASV